jgi:hypothetical protein
LRWLGAAVSVSAVVGLVAFWLPGALINQALEVVPPVTRAKIGDDLLRRIERVTGQPCLAANAAPALKTLALRTGAKNIVILRSGVRDSVRLPGGRVLINRSLIETHEEPDVAAGYILAEAVRAVQRDPLDAMLSHAGMRANISLLTTGNLPSTTLDAYAEHILLAPHVPVPDDILLKAFAAAKIRSTPYAQALDLTGETTLPLIEGDPMRAAPPELLLRDADWLRLQSICDS